MALISLLSCSKPNKKEDLQIKSDKSPIEGSWKLVYADIRENDSIQIKDLSQTDFIKIINGLLEHF